MTQHSRLERLGFSPQYLTEEQLELIESLSDAEIELLAKIRQKLDDAADVQGHNLEGGGVVW